MLEMDRPKQFSGVEGADAMFQAMYEQMKFKLSESPESGKWTVKEFYSAVKVLEQRKIANDKAIKKQKSKR